MDGEVEMDGEGRGSEVLVCCGLHNDWEGPRWEVVGHVKQ